MAFPTAPVLDYFDRPDSASLGTSWTSPLRSGDLTPTLGYESVQKVLTGSTGAYWNPSTFPADCEVYATIRGALVSEAFFQLYSRVSDPTLATFDCYVAQFTKRAGDDDWSISRFLNNSAITLKSGTLPGADNFSVGDRVGMLCVGATLSAYWYTGTGPWVTLGTVTDASVGGTGWVGLRCGMATGTTGEWFGFDEFGGGGTVAQADFTNTVVPTITGSAAIGNILTADPGTWSPTPSSFTYRWQKADDASGLNVTTIGSTGSTYTVDSGDSGKVIHVDVTPVP